MPRLPEGTDSNSSNAFYLEATLLETQPLRYTPAGVPVTQCVLAHSSRQSENGIERQVALEIPAIALGQPAQLLAIAPAGSQLRASGFLAAQSLRSKRAVFHLNKIVFIEGNQNGSKPEPIQAQG